MNEDFPELRSRLKKTDRAEITLIGAAAIPSILAEIRVAAIR
jgi:hypothetical protein